MQFVPSRISGRKSPNLVMAFPASMERSATDPSMRNRVRRFRKGDLFQPLSEDVVRAGMQADLIGDAGFVYDISVIEADARDRESGRQANDLARR